jgi:hypothetical protein
MKNYKKKYEKYNKKIDILYGGKINDPDFLFNDINTFIKEPKNVKNIDDFISFLAFLHKDFELNKKEWANINLGKYFEQCIQYYLDHKSEKFSKKNNFSNIANILLSGKYYE